MTLKYAAKYFHTVMKQVIVSKEAHDNQRKKSRIRLIKFPSLSKNIYNQINPRLAWIMFHNISHIYRYITKQETVQSLLLIKGLFVNFDSTKASGKTTETPIIYIPLQPKIPPYQKTVTAVPEDLKDIQPQPYQVCNCGNIFFDPNGSWIKVVCTYKLFTGYMMWRTHTGERAPF